MVGKSTECCQILDFRVTSRRQVNGRGEGGGGGGDFIVEHRKIQKLDPAKSD